MTTCATCHHWLPKETPRWAALMHMAVCALKRTKAVTMAHWTSCPRHQQATPKVVDARTVWLASATPRSGSSPCPTTAGNSNRVGGLFHGAAKGVDWS